MGRSNPPANPPADPRRSASPSAGPGTRGRHNGKGAGIAQFFRDAIAAGRYAPGDRLPQRRAIQTDFQTSAATVQQALRALREEGFIQTAGARGTFVADHPPVHSRYALAVRHKVAPRATGPLSLFERDLYLEADRMREAGEASFSIYQGVSGRSSAAPEHQAALTEAVRRRQFAGLILSVSWPTRGSELERAWLDTGTPVVGLSNPEHLAEGMVSLLPDRWGWIDRAVARFAEQGRQRIAVLSTALDHRLFERFDQALARYGSVCPPHWRQFVHPDMNYAAWHAVQLLMRGEPHPDGLLIFDDSLVEPATRGLADMHVRVPEDLVVIGYCNYPQVTPSPLAIDRLGFDSQAVLTQAMALIDQQRAGAAPPEQTLLSPQFEDEWQATTCERGAMDGAAPSNATSFPAGAYGKA